MGTPEGQHVGTQVGDSGPENRALMTEVETYRHQEFFSLSFFLLFFLKEMEGAYRKFSVFCRRQNVG